MKKLITATVLLLVIAAFPLSHLLMARGHKVPVCHKGHLIEISARAVAKHIAKHGDCSFGIYVSILTGECTCDMVVVDPIIISVG